MLQVRNEADKPLAHAANCICRNTAAAPTPMKVAREYLRRRGGWVGGRVGGRDWGGGGRLHAALAARAASSRAAGTRSCRRAGGRAAARAAARGSPLAHAHDKGYNKKKKTNPRIPIRSAGTRLLRQPLAAAMPAAVVGPAAMAESGENKLRRGVMLMHQMHHCSIKGPR